MYRRATLEDSIRWLSIRNDPDALFWSGNKRPITWEEHDTWFRRALNPISPNKLVVYGEGVRGCLVDAYGRIQVYNEAEVSFGVDPKRRGEGIGTGMLKALEELANEHRVNRLVAYVHPTNAASMRAFAKQGYSLETDHKHYEKLFKVL